MPSSTAPKTLNPVHSTSTLATESGNQLKTLEQIKEEARRNVELKKK